MIKNPLEDAALASAHGTRSMAETLLGNIAPVIAALEKNPTAQLYAPPHRSSITEIA